MVDVDDPEEVRTEELEQREVHTGVDVKESNLHRTIVGKESILPPTEEPLHGAEV